MTKNTKATLLLADGTRWHGFSFGYEQPTIGEVVFNTATIGYPESLTDPSYEGQIMVCTYPLIGNYGVPPCTIQPNGLSTFMESEHIHASAIIVTEYSEFYSHWNAAESIASWLQREHIPALTGIDTRALTKHLRENGVMMGQIMFDNTPDPATFDYATTNFVAHVSCSEPILYTPTKGTDTPQRVCLVDCGVCHSLIRYLIERGLEVIRVPWDYDFNGIPFDGLIISNGPGNPDTCDKTLEHLQQFLVSEPKRAVVRPVMGICLGHQLLGKVSGASVFKLKYGHHGHNQPVRLLGSDGTSRFIGQRCFITSQNHGYAINTNTLSSDWEPMFTNLNDGSNEGIRHKTLPWFSVQFTPECGSGAVETEYLYDQFIQSL